MSKIAIFFDAENVPSKKVPEIIQFLSTRGDILFQRAYADWSNKTTRSWREQISRTPITAIQQFHHNQEQAVDKAVLMDAVEMALTHDEIDLFVIVASDNGYYSLSLKLRELGKRVIGIGEKEKCNPIWINSCNEFTYFEDLEEDDENILLEKKPNAGSDGDGNFQEYDSDSDEDSEEFRDFALEQFVEKAFDLTPFYKDTNTILLSRMWETIHDKQKDFNVKKYGFKNALDFISSFDKLFKITDDGKPQRTFFVEKIKDSLSLRKTGVIKKRAFNYRIIAADDRSGDYFFYMGDINKEFKGSKVEKGAHVDFLVEKEPDSQATSTKDKNGKAVDLMVLE